MAWSDRHRPALASGVLLLVILSAPVQELDPKRHGAAAGMSLVGLAFALFLIRLNRRVRAREEALAKTAAHAGAAAASGATGQAERHAIQALP